MVDSSGIGITIQGLLNHFTSDQKKHLVLLSSPGWQKADGMSTVTVPYPIYSLSQHWRYPPLLKKLNLSLFHMPHFDVPLFYRGPFVVTIHDLIHVLFPQYSTKPFSRWYAYVCMRHIAKHAAKIIAVSENTKKDYLHYFPDAQNKVQVIHPAVDQTFQPVSGNLLSATLRKHNLEPGYLLSVGNLRGSKNTMGLLSAYETVRKNINNCSPLVLVGRNSYPQFRRNGFPPGVHQIEAVERNDLPALYSGASLFVFPSFYEGFGLPPLEAMACGLPVIASKVASLPDVCGEAASYIDPSTPLNISEAIIDLLHHAEKREALRQKGFENVKRFSWHQFASSTWKLYEDAVQKGL
ncbi:MAG: glycosyltransferase family 4 protein [Elusimicrobia bacterium]|nr:glycosyltransferase family 4 protein [Candidatus Obscuribacterium magneticum]